MSTLYHPGHRDLQDQFDTRRLADRLEEVKVHSAFTDDDRRFIQDRDMFFLATSDSIGQPNCSYKGGAAGFVRVLDAHTLAFPSYDGNGMFLSLGNVTVNGCVGLLFIDFQNQRRLRVNGTAVSSATDALMGEYPGAQMIVRVTATQVFPNCPRYIHRMAPVEASPFVPVADHAAPIPAWKRSEWARDVLPAGDPAGDAANDASSDAGPQS